MSFLFKILSDQSNKLLKKWEMNQSQVQAKVFRKLMHNLSHTKFGKDFKLHPKMTIAEFQNKVPLMEYEDYEKSYIPGLLDGKKDILWPGKIKYICQSSGTTSGQKYIPVSKSGVLAFVKTSLLSSFIFMHKTKTYDLFKRKIFHLYGLSKLKEKNGVILGFIGHLANSFVPDFLVKSKYPSTKEGQFTNWQSKVEFLAHDLKNQDLSVLSGTPPWMNNVLERFYEIHGKTFDQYFPNLKLYIHGGCNFKNYRSEFFRLFGKKQIYTMEVYPASEGYIAFQDDWDMANPTAEKDMRLNIGLNIFFEFLLYENGKIDKSHRYLVDELEVGKVYTLVLSTMGSYISYIIGDNIQVTNTMPLRIVFAGRSKQNINLVNEHMDFGTVQLVFEELNLINNNRFKDYILLPKITDSTAQYHWYLSCETTEGLIEGQIATSIGNLCKSKNEFFKQWHEADIIQDEKVTFVNSDTFLKFLATKNSAGQNKVPNVILDELKQNEFINFLN